MLSRIANNLFWMGRYLERAEHLAQYIKIQYVSSLDAPLAYSKELALESILHLTGSTESYHSQYDKLTDMNVLFHTTFADENPSSIKNSIKMARENARGGRDELASEAWEVINRLYHYTCNFPGKDFPDEKRYDFYQYISDNTYIIKGTLRGTHLVNVVLAMINIGLHLERAIQVCHILSSKLRDIEQTTLSETMTQTMGTMTQTLTRSLKSTEEASALENYHCGNMLKSAGGFDMSRKFYKSLPNKRNSIEFLALNPSFTRSISYNLERICRNLEIINDSQRTPPGSAKFLSGKLNARLRYMTIEEMEGREEEALNDILQLLYQFGNQFDKEYLGF